MVEKFGFVDPREIDFENIRSKNGTKVLLTFDDGFASNRFVAEAVLKPLGIYAIFFVTHDFIGLNIQDSRKFAQTNFYRTRRISESDGNMMSMSWLDIEWLASAGHVIGAHTFTHPKLSTLSTDKKRIEIINAADRVEQRLAISIRQFAYPFGALASVDEASVEIARERFDVAYSNIRGFFDESPSRHFVFRQNLVPGAPLWMVDAVIEGRLDWGYSNDRREALARFPTRNIGK